MASTRRAVTPDTFGAWLVKGSPGVSGIEELLRTGFRTVTERCVRPSYRTRFVEVGQPVLFWVSGTHAAFPAGLYAQGRTTGPPVSPERDGPQAGAVRLDLPMVLEPLAPPVPRSELLAHPTLCRIEVLRMAAGSNPSFLTRTELQELRTHWPQVTVD